MNVPLTGIEKRFFNKTISYLKKKKIPILNSNGRKTSSKKKIDINYVIFANYCHLINEVVAENKRREIDYNQIKRYIIENSDVVRDILKNCFQYNEVLMERFLQEFVQTEKVDMIEMSMYSGLPNSYTKNIYH